MEINHRFNCSDNIFSLQKLSEEIYAQFIINGVFGVDTFFLMRFLNRFISTISILMSINCILYFKALSC